MSSPFIYLHMQITIRPIHKRLPMELTENDVRDLIPMDGGAHDGGGESSDGGGAHEAGTGGEGVVEVKVEVLTAVVKGRVVGDREEGGVGCSGGHIDGVEKVLADDEVDEVEDEQEIEETEDEVGGGEGGLGGREGCGGGTILNIYNYF